MALIGHPILGDRRYSYAYAKQYAQHNKLQDGDDGEQAADHGGSSYEEEAACNSASVARSR